MGRAQRGVQAITGDGFEGVLGSRRGTPPNLQGLATPQPTASGTEHLTRLQRDIKAGELDEAVRILTKNAEGIGNAPLLKELAGSVADVVSQDVVDSARAAYSFPRTFLHALGISPRTARNLVYDGKTQVIHIWPEGDHESRHDWVEMRPGYEGHAACGKLLRGATADNSATSFGRAPRGSWMAPPEEQSSAASPYTACPACAEHAHAYPECREPRDHPLLSEATDAHLRVKSSADTEDLLLARLKGGGLDVESLKLSVQQRYARDLREVTAQYMVDGAEPALKRVLGVDAAYLYSQREFGARRRLRPDRELAPLLDKGGWMKVFEKCWEEEISGDQARYRSRITRELFHRARVNGWKVKTDAWQSLGP